VSHLAFFRKPESEVINLLPKLGFVIADTRDRFAHSLQIASFHVIALDFKKKIFTTKKRYGIERRRKTQYIRLLLFVFFVSSWFVFLECYREIGNGRSFT